MPEPFPRIPLDTHDSDANPAVRLYGRRFFADQTTLELLIEFLLVATSPKRLGSGSRSFDSLLPSREMLQERWEDELKYAPRARLNLKLFAFFGASKLDSRHETHRDHLRHLDEVLKARMRVSDDTPENVLKTLENLFLGFHGVGMQRTWCAQSFIPVCQDMVACESIWQQTKARGVVDWSEALDYFSHRQAIFLSRGGELLYLQLCNALRRSRSEVETWLADSGLSSMLTTSEKDPVWLCEQLQAALAAMLAETPSTVSQLAEFIDRSVDEETSTQTDGEKNDRRWTSCGWCPQETWHESYLFAVELLRGCRANLDLMDRLDLLETLCALHVMRCLVTQASRYASPQGSLAWPPYRLAISDPDGNNQTVKQVSRASVQAVSKTIFDGLRHPDIFDKTPAGNRDRLYKEADRRYGHKLFKTLGKRIGMIVPRRGAGERFVLNGRILRLLVVSLCSGRRITYDTFREAARAHFGLVFDESGLGQANGWATGVQTESFGKATDDWLIKMLEEAGALRRLSDSCALVENAAAVGEQEVLA